MDTDSYGVPAPKPAKELCQDLCSSFILPANRLVYDEAPTVEACENMLGHLSLVRFSLVISYLLVISRFGIKISV